MTRVCINEGKLCNSCSRNFSFTDYFQEYHPTCRFGYYDCINDPAYILCYHKQWYHDMWGGVLPQDVTDCNSCINGSDYDDEDK